jgi:hypothetical protein
VSASAMVRDVRAQRVGHTASHDSAPMILFISQLETGVRGREAFQEVDIARVFEPVPKWTAEIDTTDRVPALVGSPFRIATFGRQDPLVIRCLRTRSPTSPTRRNLAPCMGQWDRRGRADIGLTMDVLAQAGRASARGRGMGVDRSDGCRSGGVRRAKPAAGPLFIPMSRNS